MMSLISAKLSANSDTVEAAEAYLPSSCHNQHIFSFDKVLTTWVCVFTFAALQRAVSLLLLRKYKSEFRLLCLDRTPIWLLPHFFTDTLSLMRKSLYKQPSYLCLYCSSESYLLSRHAPHLIWQSPEP